MTADFFFVSLPVLRAETGAIGRAAWGFLSSGVGGRAALVAPMVRLLAVMTSILAAIRLFPRVVSLDMREEYHKKMLTQVYR